MAIDRRNRQRQFAGIANLYCISDRMRLSIAPNRGVGLAVGGRVTRDSNGVDLTAAVAVAVTLLPLITSHRRP